MKHHHSIERGCKLIPNLQYGRTTRTRTIRGYYCKTHKIDVCHCGFAWGWHGGEKADGPQRLPRGPKIQVKCKGCGKIFSVTPSRYKTTGNYHNLKCFRKHKSRTIDTNI